MTSPKVPKHKQITHIQEQHTMGPINHRVEIPQAPQASGWNANKLWVQSTIGLEYPIPLNYRVGMPTYYGSNRHRDGIPSSPQPSGWYPRPVCLCTKQ